MGQKNRDREWNRGKMKIKKRAGGLSETPGPFINSGSMVWKFFF